MGPGGPALVQHGSTQNSPTLGLAAVCPHVTSAPSLPMIHYALASLPLARTHDSLLLVPPSSIHHAPRKNYWVPGSGCKVGAVRGDNRVLSIRLFVLERVVWVSSLH